MAHDGLFKPQWLDDKGTASTAFKYLKGGEAATADEARGNAHRIWLTSHHGAPIMCQIIGPDGMPYGKPFDASRAG